MSMSNDARATILRRIREALQDVPTEELPEAVTVTRDYQRSGTMEREQRIAHFIERITDYKVTVHCLEAQGLPEAIANACTSRGIRRLVIPADLPASWRPANVELLCDDPPLSYAQLDTSDGVLTGCALGIAQTGTIVLDGGARQGRRVLSLLPDYHLCVIWEDQIVERVSEAVASLTDAVRLHQRSITLISGPSATSDIELNRVEGVHGPRTLEVLVVAERLTGGRAPGQIAVLLF